MPPLDPRQAAFNELVNLANATAAALQRVDEAVNEERKPTQPLRAGWTPTQFAASLGLSRFNYGVRELGNEWEKLANVARVSSPSQELGQMFLWTLGTHYILRVKHEPVEGVAAGAQRLFEQPSLGVEPVQLFLTWTVSRAGNIILPAFVCVDEPAFTIPLSQLVEAANAPVRKISTRRPSPRVRSKRAKRRDAERDEG